MDGPGLDGLAAAQLRAAPSQMWAARAPRRGTARPEPSSTSCGPGTVFWALCLFTYWPRREETGLSHVLGLREQKAAVARPECC